ncbi:hypothetical protein EHS13_27415 [Paenibacillus psychroresistens]|uniref:DUF1680 family protein n=1 Tax=Paenibacillus psychroresistens TaxID=1778678 RepID=A0A6B8RR67_9BACL|nr:beta-L-arabinofuranosidase domain-containing protein [Paenibacillus psychroresistens]QGQ98347.1 hypothetical protein EHS13_27415 [Paenibacillus psychroresistens]
MTLVKTAFESLPLRSIKPLGWLKDQLRIQADGLTGHLGEHWADVGPQSGWLGGEGESWERGPYYVDGMLPLAYLLEDERLIAKANKWVEWTLASQQEDGMFGPKRINTVNNDINHNHDWWHYMIMLKVLMQHEEATGDSRIVPFLNRFFQFVHLNIEKQPLFSWAEARGAEMLLCIYWLYQRSPNPTWLELAHIIKQQTIDWTAVFADFPFWRKVESWDHKSHVVNVAMGLKAPGTFYQLSGDPKELDAINKGIKSLMKFHGQAHGMFSGDEWLSGTNPSQGVELCAVVEYMFSLENLVRIYGVGQFGDILEKVAFNALPAAISADWTSHQYDQQVNQVMCNVAKRDWSNGADANVFGLEPHFGCCTANMHQGWPKLASHLWMSDGNGGLAAVSYAPCLVRTKVGNGSDATLEVSGGYPFNEEITMKLTLSSAEQFALSLRIPAWCDKPSLLINNVSVTLSIVNGYASIQRHWLDGDTIQLFLPMEVVTHSAHNFAIQINRGPLVYVLPITENWQKIVERAKFHDWEVYPMSPWKYGISSEASFEVVEGIIPKQPFEAANSPIKLRTSGQLIRDWRMEGNNADTPPIHPNVDGQAEQELLLVPYGSSRLRIGEFPLIGKRQ